MEEEELGSAHIEVARRYTAGHPELTFFVFSSSIFPKCPGGSIVIPRGVSDLDWWFGVLKSHRMYTLSIVFVVSGIALMVFGGYQAYFTSNQLYQCDIAPNSVCTLTYPQVLNSSTILYIYEALFSVGMVALLAGVVFYVGSQIVVDK